MSKGTSCESEGGGIVLRGSFNPGIYHPAWLARNELISEQGAKAAEITQKSPGFLHFTTEDFIFLSDEDRLQILAIKADMLPALLDLTIGILKNLPHTPLTACGINRDMHFSVESEDSMHFLGDVLAPKEPWNHLMEDPRLSRIDFRGELPSGLPGWQNVQIEPSRKVRPGIYIHTNAHIDIEGEEEDSSDKVIEILTNEWDRTLDHSKSIAEGIMRICEREGK